jgi:RHH-type transcriptional regulator, rel operon repressor / antitoxin RelB
MNGAPDTTTLTMRVRHALKKRLEKLSRSTGRSRSYLAAEAISTYLDTNEWQVARIKQAIRSLDAGKGIPHEHVREWVASWGAKNERPQPAIA